MSDTREYCCTEGACPFAYTEESEQVQNYGCLPTPIDIVNMKVNHDKTWACHSNPTKPCMGALKYFEKNDIPTTVNGELLTEDSDWHLFIDKEG